MSLFRISSQLTSCSSPVSSSLRKHAMMLSGMLPASTIASTARKQDFAAAHPRASCPALSLTLGSNPAYRPQSQMSFRRTLRLEQDDGTFKRAFTPSTKSSPAATWRAVLPKASCTSALTCASNSSKYENG